MSQGAPKLANRPPEAGKREGLTLLHRYQKELSPAMTLIRTSSLQNHERMHFSFKPPGLCCFVTAAPGNLNTEVHGSGHP